MATFITSVNFYFGIGLGGGWQPGYGLFVVLPFVVIAFEKDEKK